MDLDAVFQEALDGFPQRLVDEYGAERLEALGEELTVIIRNAVMQASEQSAKGVARRLREDGPAMLRARRRDQLRFERALAERWGRAFDLAEMAIVVAYEAGEAFNLKHQHKAGDEYDLVFAALVRLHARGCRIANEALALLKSGYGQAALARWRVLHEVAVVAVFISTHGQRTAERYFDHGGVETWRAMQEYQQHAARLRYEPYTEDEVQAAQAAFELLCTQYGKAFAGPYGWAQEALATENPSVVKKWVTISAIEASVGLSHLRPHYRMASYGTHANPKGVTFTPDVLPGRPVLLAGPGVAGLADAGRCSLISLMQVTTTLLTYKVGPSAPIILGALLGLTDDAGAAYLEAHRAVAQGPENASD
ncbi:MAG: hypothetical protein QOI73_2719 [Solirubrobacteraceae bacterium]|nr:hypothetical protein [Solirubrobacteraceae bacterium]